MQQDGYASDDLIRQRLAAELNKGATRKQLCQWLRISEPFLSQFLSRARPHASPTMLKVLGYDPARYYKRLDHG
jgi:predicted transcriptional regulator